MIETEIASRRCPVGHHDLHLNQHGVVFQKNLGANTASLAASMRRFAPDDSWKKTTP